MAFKYSNKKIILLPKINNPVGIKTPDYLINGEYFDYKYTTGSSNQLIYHNLYGQKEQAFNFIIEITNNNLDMTMIYKQVNYTFKRLKWLRIMAIKRNNNFFVFERKKEATRGEKVTATAS